MLRDGNNVQSAGCVRTKQMDSEAFKRWLASKGPQNARVRSDILSRCRRAEKFYGIDLDALNTTTKVREFDKGVYLNEGNLFQRVKDVIRARNQMRYALAYYWQFRKIPFEAELKYLGVKGKTRGSTRKGTHS